MILQSTLDIDVVKRLKELMVGRQGPEYAILEIACEQLEYYVEALEHAETSATYWEMKFKGTWPGDGVEAEELTHENRGGFGPTASDGEVKP